MPMKTVSFRNPTEPKGCKLFQFETRRPDVIFLGNFLVEIGHGMPDSITSIEETKTTIATRTAYSQRTCRRSHTVVEFNRLKRFSRDSKLDDPNSWLCRVKYFDNAGFYPYQAVPNV